MKYLLYALLAWFLYNLVFRLIIPVIGASRQMRRKIREMQKMQEAEHQQPTGFKPPAGAGSVKPRSEDYIEFEEIK